LIQRKDVFLQYSQSGKFIFYFVTYVKVSVLYNIILLNPGWRDPDATFNYGLKSIHIFKGIQNPIQMTSMPDKSLGKWLKLISDHIELAGD